MKFKITFVLITLVKTVFGQELSTNPQTGLVSIVDSISLKNRTLQEVKEAITKWGHSLLDMENLKAVYHLSNAKQTEMVAINLPVGTVLTQERGPNKFLTNGTLTYSKTKTSGLNAFAPVATFGGIKFSFSYTVTAQKLVYEFSNMEYSHDMVHYGKFEDDAPPKDNYNRSLLLGMGKKEWKKVRDEYFANLKVLADNFKEYGTNAIGDNVKSSELSPVNYDSYKLITIGMAYEDVKRILKDEGKELSNGSSQLNGKAVLLQTIVWYDLDRSKSITVSFTDGKVSSKSQTNL